MHCALLSAGKDVRMDIYPGQTHGSIWNHSDRQEQITQDIAEFAPYINTL